MSAWYRTGTITSSGNVVTGTGTLWADNKMGIGSGQMLLVPGDGVVRIFEISSIDSNTQLRLVAIPDAPLAGNYAIASFYTDSVPDFARRLAAQLSYYQSQMDGWQKILTGTGIINLIAPDGTVVSVPSMSYIIDHTMPIGAPIPWPTNILPDGWIPCDGTPFNTTLYPKLAWIYPSGRTPDLRGEFIRGWDAGLGIDRGRQLLSKQAATKLPSIYTYNESTYNATLVTPTLDSLGQLPSDSQASDYEGETLAPGTFLGTPLTQPGLGGIAAFRVRPRNIAFYYIVRGL
jgi:hypothetical protein